MWEAKVKIIRLSRKKKKKTQIEASSALAVPPTAPLLYYRVIKHSFLSQASSLITQWALSFHFIAGINSQIEACKAIKMCD